MSEVKVYHGVLDFDTVIKGGVNLPSKMIFEEAVLKSDYDTLKAKLAKAVEALEYYAQFSTLPPNIQIKERIGGGKAAQTLKEIGEV